MDQTPFEGWVIANLPKAIGTAVLALGGFLIRDRWKRHERAHHDIGKRLAELEHDHVSIDDMKDLRDSNRSEIRDGFDRVAKLIDNRMRSVEETQQTILRAHIRGN